MAAERRSPAADADALLDALDRSEVHAVVALAGDWPETHRAAVRKHAGERLEQRAWQIGWKDKERAKRQALTAALLAVGTPTMIERHRRLDQLDDEAVVTLLRGRAASVLHGLQTALSAFTAWDLLGPLWRAGMVEATEPVVTAMVRGLADARDDPWRHDDSFLRGLRAQPDVLDRGLLWRLFDHEAALAAAAQRVTWDHEPGRTGGRGTGRRCNQVVFALDHLADDGSIDRQRLLDATIDALERDLATAPNRFLVHLHERLAPTTEERAARQDRYVHLLHHQRPLTVSVALDVLRQLDDAGALSGQARADLGAGLSGPLTHTQRNLAVAALQLLDRLACQEGMPGLQALTTVVGALGHPRADVQERAVALLARRWPDHGEAAAELRAALLGWVEVVPTTLRGEVARLTGIAAPADAGQGEEADGEIEGVLAEVARLGTALPPACRDQLAAAAGAIAARAWTPPLRLPPPDRHLLTPERRVPPVADLEELVELLLRLLETTGDPARSFDVLTMERAMDGLSRLFLQRPRGFHALTASLRRRTEDTDALRWWRRRMADAPVDVHLTVAVRAWLQPPRLGGRARAWLPRRQAALVLTRRLERLAVRIVSGRPGSLLAFPTHAPSWVAADVLAERLAGATPDRVDLEAALLRCAGDRGPVADALDRQGLRHAGAGLLEPDALPPAPGLEVREVKARWDSYHGLAVGDTAPLRDHPSTLVRLAAQQLAARPEDHLFDEAAASTLAALPAVADAAAAQQLYLASRPGYGWVDHHGEALLSLLLDADRPLTEPGHAALVCALTSERAPTRTLGTDVLLQAACDGRLDPERFGRTLAWLTEACALKLNRLEQPLAEGLMAGPLARYCMEQALEATIGALTSTPRSVHVLLEAWLNARAEGTAVVMRPEARSWLEQAAAGTGTSRRRRAAQRLLEATDGSAPVAPAQAAAAALLDRARRWSTHRPATPGT